MKGLILDKNKKNDFPPRIRPGAGRFCKGLPSTAFSRSGAGFTLVEVVVVLAIMSVIIAIIMVSMGESRKEGEDAAIKSALRELRSAAEYYNDNNKTYDGVCDDADNTLANDGSHFERIENYITGYQDPGGELKCLDSADGYAAIASLNLGNCWCVDHQGSSKEIVLGAGETCNNKLVGITCP